MENMSCIEFVDGTGLQRVCIKSDIAGDTSAMLEQLAAFLDSLEASLDAPPFDDPNRLAVLYVQCYAQEFTGRASNFTDFFKIRMTDLVPNGCAVKYTVDCEHLGQDGRPPVSYEVM